MRELKFRAWDEEKGKVYPILSLDWSDGSLSIEVNRRGNSVFIEDSPVMQYTGLKDKNDKEIYEGDIVLYNDTESEHVDVGIGDVKVAEQEVNSMASIEYKDGEFGIIVNAKYGETLQSKQWYSIKEFIDETEWIEVIGNIHENKELIN